MKPNYGGKWNTRFSVKLSKMRVSAPTYTAVVIVLGVLATNVDHGLAQSTRRPLIPGLPALPPMLQSLSFSNLPGISHIMNMPLPFNVPFRYVVP